MGWTSGAYFYAWKRQSEEGLFHLKLTSELSQVGVGVGVTLIAGFIELVLFT